MNPTISNANMLKAFSLFLFFLISGIYAYEIPSNFTKGTLDASVPPSLSLSFNESPYSFDYTITVNNPSSEVIQLYFAQKVDSTWQVLSELGNVSPQSSANKSFRIRFEYASATTQTGEYAIISDQLMSKPFKITENWSAYESKTKSAISLMGFVLTPIIALFLIFLHYLVTRESAKRRENHIDRVIALLSECNSFSERMIFILSSPVTWVLSALLIFLLMGYLALSAHPEADMFTVLALLMVSMVTAYLIPFILLVLVWYGDIYEREPLKYMFSMFIWGVLAAFLAFFINPVLISLFNLPSDSVPLVLVVVFGSIIISPLSEETLKAIGVYVMSCHREMSSTLDGLLYGFAVGVGFAAVENTFYFLSKMDPLVIGIDAWLLSVLYRSFFNTIAHGCFTAFVGAMVGMIKTRPRIAGYHYLGLLPGLFIAIILHMIFNLSAFLDIVAIKTFRTVVLFFNPLLVVTVGVGFVIIYYFGLRETKKTQLEL